MDLVEVVKHALPDKQAFSSSVPRLKIEGNAGARGVPGQGVIHYRAVCRRPEDGVWGAGDPSERDTV